MRIIHTTSTETPCCFAGTCAVTVILPVGSGSAARGKIDRKTGQQKSEGLVSREMMRTWVEAQGVELRGAGEVYFIYGSDDLEVAA